MAPESKHKYSLEENWPQTNLIRHPRNAGGAIQGVVHMALWKLGFACHEGIKAENIFKVLAEPTKQIVAHPGPAVESVNRD